MMSDYRRMRIKGGCYFFTVNLQNRWSNLLVSDIDKLRHAVLHTQQTQPFVINAWVVLPDHMHCIWTLPEDDADFSSRWKSLKTRFTKSIDAHRKRTRHKFRPGERTIWQHRFWEHALRDERDYQNHFNYIHYNPVKHRLVTRTIDWPYSTFHRYVRDGIYTADWGCTEKFTGAFGERQFDFRTNDLSVQS